MSMEDHHAKALIETAQLELDRAHRGALAMEAGEIRRGLQAAIDALAEAGSHAELAGRLRTALADLDGGQLAGTDTIIEAARRDLV